MGIVFCLSVCNGHEKCIFIENNGHEKVKKQEVIGPLNFISHPLYKFNGK